MQGILPAYRQLRIANSLSPNLRANPFVSSNSPSPFRTNFVGGFFFFFLVMVIVLPGFLVANSITETSTKKSATELVAQVLHDNVAYHVWPPQGTPRAFPRIYPAGLSRFCSDKKTLARNECESRKKVTNLLRAG